MKCVRDLCAMSDLALVKKLSDGVMITVSFAPSWGQGASRGAGSLIEAASKSGGNVASGRGSEGPGAAAEGSVTDEPQEQAGWRLMRVRSRSKFLRPRLLLFSFVLLFCCVAVSWSQSTQTAVSISNTVETPGIDRPGINLGGIGGYGSQQLLKSLNYVNGGDFPDTYAGTTYGCSNGGSNTTTSWYNNVTDPTGYPANFWAGATFIAINASTGAHYGTGTVTASTSNTGSTGVTFTLSPALSTACNPSQNDVIIVRSTSSPNSRLTPYQVLNTHVCSNATWDMGDTSPASSNTRQSLEMPDGCGLTFYMDATVSNRTNTNPGLASQQVNFINLNGSYTATFKAKCLVSGCSVNFNLGRLGGATFVGNTTVNPSSAGPGAGWTTYTYPFTASETGSQGMSLGYSFNCRGTCLLQDADVVEGSTLAGNTSPFRDAVVYELEKIHPGSIRYMDSSQWCSDVADEIATTGNRRWCGVSNYAPGVGQPLGYADVLTLGNVIGSDVLLSVGQLNEPADWALLMNWLSTSGWVSTYASSGHTIYLEAGNEAWNSGVGGTLYYGNGFAYGSLLGPDMAAAKAAAGYNPSVIKLVGDSWVAGSQGYGPFGWIHNALGVAQATPNGLPDFVDDAPYTLNYLGKFDTSGANVATTGAPFLDEWAEIANIDSVTSPQLYTQSMYLNTQYVKANYGVGTLVYEVNESTTNGIAATQLQLDQIDASVGNALSIAEHVLLMQRDSQVTGPIHVFTLAEPYTGYSCNGCAGGPVMPLWGTNLFMGTGPGQTPGSANADRPLAIALGVIDNAIGTNNNLMSITQTGTPTFNYGGGQPQGGSNTISPNNAVPYVNCFSYSGASGWTTICFNNNLTTAETVNLSGAGAPTGLVSETVFPGPSNVITDHNENTYLGASSIPPVVGTPSATTTSGTSYTIPPASMIALTYASGGGISVPNTPTLGTPSFSPGTGTYSGTQTVTIAFPGGSTGCVGINSIPTASTAGTCGSGGTMYTGPITVNTSETVYAIATAAGSLSSLPGAAVYTLAAIATPGAATPSFSVASGTYTTSQSVSISDATAGATIYYTTNGSAPTTSSSVYGGPISVGGTETLEAIATKSGYTSSPVATAAYTISPVSIGSGAINIGLGQFTASSFYLNNGANVSADGKLQVTDGGYGEGRSAWFSTEVPINNFVTDFTFQLNNANADGMTFVIQAQGPYALGGSGGSLGYQGIPSSVAIKFDLYDNAGEGVNSTGLYTGGAMPTLPAIDLSSTGINLHSGHILDAHMVYDGTNLTMTLTDTVTAASVVEVFPVNIPAAVGGSMAYVGFAGGTGGLSAAQNILTWTYASGGGSVAVPTSLPAPSFSVAGGTYTGSQSVSLSDATAGATIYYTTNGTTPTTSASVYGGPIAVSASEILEAIAVESGYTTSGVSSATYTIRNLTLPAPSFSVAAGTYTTAQSVGIGEATAGATIYYTTDGSAPTTSSNVYSGPVTIGATETLEAIAVESGYTSSPVGAAAYTINVASTGSGYINFASGQFTASSFYLNNGANVTSNGVLQVTDGGYGEGRSAWFSTVVPISNFVTDFTFQINNANADGMTFVIQAQGPYALGGSGGSLGYQGIPSSVAIKFDLYDNAGEGVNSTGLYTGGAMPTLPAVDLSSTGINLHSGHILDAHMVYDGTNLTMTLTDTVTAATVVEVFPVNIPAAVGGSMAYVGFAGGTGGLSAVQNILTWTYAAGH